MLRMENVSKKLSNRLVIQSVSFRVPTGSFFTLLGNSGTGKTTLLKLAAGLITTDQGAIFICEKNVTRVPADERRIPMIFQQPFLFPHLTVRQNIAFGLEVVGFEKSIIHKKVNQLLMSLQIEELASRMPSTLSGGQQQRVSIARALAPGNSLILMDEPFSSLDPSLRREMGQLVKALQRQMDLTVIFVTHDVREALQLSDEILLLKDGQVLETGTPKKLFENPEKIDTARFMESGNLIQGRIEKEQFQCLLGIFSASGMSEGPAFALFPEEQIVLNAGKTLATISEIRYLGKSRRIQASCHGQSFWIEDLSRQPFSVGQSVTLGFPEEVHLIHGDGPLS